jgi:hypothetical protein
MAKIKLNNNNYSISNSTLSAPTANFVAHLATIAGTGLRVVVDGVEYSVDSTKTRDAVTALETTFSALSGGSASGGDQPVVMRAAGLYQTGTDTMVASWDELIANGNIIVEDGAVWGDYSKPVVGDLVLPDDNSITSLPGGAFEECSSLTSVVIGDSVTRIDDYAFYYCTSLTSVEIGDSVTSIGYNAFSGCSSIADVYYKGTEEQWSAIFIDNNNTELTNATIHYNYQG